MIMFGRWYMDLTITATIFLEIVKGVVKSSSGTQENHSVAQLISALGDVSTAVQNIDLLNLCKTVNKRTPRQAVLQRGLHQNEERPMIDLFTVVVAQLSSKRMA